MSVTVARHTTVTIKTRKTFATSLYSQYTLDGTWILFYLRHISTKLRQYRIWSVKCTRQDASLHVFCTDPIRNDNERTQYFTRRN